MASPPRVQIDRRVPDVPDARGHFGLFSLPGLTWRLESHFLPRGSAATSRVASPLGNTPVPAEEEDGTEGEGLSDHGIMKIAGRVQGTPGVPDRPLRTGVLRQRESVSDKKPIPGACPLSLEPEPLTLQLTNFYSSVRPQGRSDVTLTPGSVIPAALTLRSDHLPLSL